MKILFINVVSGIRSTGRIVAEQAEDFLSHGDEVRIAYGREKPGEKYKDISYRIGTELDVRINGIKARVFDNECFNAVKQTKEFIKWADNYNPDLLWLHNLHGYYINIDLLFGWIKSRPQMQVRWTLHDCWSFTGHCSHFSLINCDRWKTGCHHCPQLRSYPAGLFIENSFENYRHKKEIFCGVKNMTIITPSRWLADLVGQSFLKEYKTKVVNNTIDTDVFKPTDGDFRKKHGINDKKIVLGVASSWNKEKGIEDFISISKMLDDSYVVVMVGLTAKQIKKMPSSIICIERTDSAYELAEIYSSADVFVNTSYQETYPTVNLEARACGTKCLAYNSGGAGETVDSENLVERGNLNQMVEKIKKVCLEG